MFPLTYGKIYKTPEAYQPPEDSELVAITEYPNLNSRDYAKRPLNRTLRMHTSWECIALDGEHHAVIGINKLSGREWNGSLWGFENPEELTAENACYKLQCNALVTQLKFISKNILVLALDSGAVQVWSTYSDMRDERNPYSLYLIGEKCEHMKTILCMSVMKACETKCATGSKDGTLKLWDLGSSDLFSVNTYRFAHTDGITGISSSNNDASVYATCSLDKSALLWDDRLARPAMALFEDHNVRFKDLAWACHDDLDNFLHIGDECGIVHDIDMRTPKTFIKSTLYSNRPIRKIVPKGQYLAVIADSNEVKVSSAGHHEVIYTNVAQNLVRDAVWVSNNELWTVGFDAKLRKHLL